VKVDACSGDPIADLNPTGAIGQASRGRREIGFVLPIDEQPLHLRGPFRCEAPLDATARGPSPSCLRLGSRKGRRARDIDFYVAYREATGGEEQPLIRGARRDADATADCSDPILPGLARECGIEWRNV